MGFDLANPDRPIHVGVILMKSETEILDVAPVDLLNGIGKHTIKQLPLSDRIKSQAMDMKFHWVGENGGETPMTSGITLKCTDSFETCPPLDIVLMGANMMSYQPTEAELAFVRKAYNDCSAFLTICGGFEIPCRAGIFKDKTVTAPRFFLDVLRQQHPLTTWVEKRWHRDGKLWTSGALLNGLDLMKAFAEHTWASRVELIGAVIDLGSWPVRDINYKDEVGCRGDKFDLANIDMSDVVSQASGMMA